MKVTIPEVPVGPVVLKNVTIDVTKEDLELIIDKLLPLLPKVPA